MSIYRMTEAEQTKLTGIETGAEVNVLESVTVNGAALTITSKNVTLPQANTTDTDGVMTWEDKAKHDAMALGTIDTLQVVGGGAPDSAAYSMDPMTAGFVMTVGKRYRLQFVSKVVSAHAETGFRFGLYMEGTTPTATITGIIRVLTLSTNTAEVVAPLYAVGNSTMPAGSSIQTTAGDTTIGSMVSLDAIINCTGGTLPELFVGLGSENESVAVTMARNSSMFIITELDSIV